MWTVARWRAGEVVQRDRLMLIEEEAREAAERGYSRSFKYPLRTGVGIPTMTQFRLPGGRAIGRTRRSDYREMRSFLVLFLIFMFLSIHIFYCTCKKVCPLYISSHRTVYSVIYTFDSPSKLSAFVHS